jgi:hypothetical protein
MITFREVLLGICTGIGLVIIMTIVFTIPTWLLWNWLCPQLFGLPKITLLQSLGLLLLTGFLFRSSGKR